MTAGDRAVAAVFRQGRRGRRSDRRRWGIRGRTRRSRRERGRRFLAVNPVAFRQNIAGALDRGPEASLPDGRRRLALDKTRGRDTAAGGDCVPRRSGRACRRRTRHADFRRGPQEPNAGAVARRKLASPPSALHAGGKSQDFLAAGRSGRLTSAWRVPRRSRRRSAWGRRGAVMCQWVWPRASSLDGLGQDAGGFRRDFTKQNFGQPVPGQSGAKFRRRQFAVVARRDADAVHAPAYFGAGGVHGSAQRQAYWRQGLSSLLNSIFLPVRKFATTVASCARLAC